MKMVRKAGALAVLTAGIVVSAAVGNPAQALNIVTFTNLSDWQAAVFNDVLQDLNSEATGIFTNRDFGDFTATRTSSDIGMSVQPAAAGNSVDGTNNLQFRSTFAEPESMDWTFDFGIRALAFDWRNVDGSNDAGELIIDGQQVATFPALSNGFLGVVATDMTFDTVSFSDTNGGGGILALLSLDNIRYATTLAVPEPGALALFGLGLAGIGFAVRRKRKAG